MRIIRVFPRRTSHTPTDSMAFIGDPPLFRPEADEVHVSCTFTWDLPEAGRLAEAWAFHYPTVKVGGPALNDPGMSFEPGLYVKDGYTFTSKGCDNRCPWCLVPPREGSLHLFEPIPEGWKINDNNFLQTPREHRRKVYAMLGRQKPRASFVGGLQASLVTGEIAAELRDIRIEDVFLAADTEAALKPLERAISRLSFLPARHMRSYVLIGYGGEAIEHAEMRLRRVYELGSYPFAMLYQPPTYRRIEWPHEWRALQRTWSRPAAMKAEMRANP